MGGEDNERVYGSLLGIDGAGIAAVRASGAI
jgi:hypothetical protein